ncbi:MAG: hypothetical protein ACREKE_07840 [bacterium]
MSSKRVYATGSIELFPSVSYNCLSKRSRHGNEYLVEYVRDIIGDYTRRFLAAQTAAENRVVSAQTPSEKQQAQRLLGEIAQAKARLGNFIRDLARAPHKTLKPPPMRLECDADLVLEFRPQAVYKGKPARPVTARALVNESKKSVLVYVIRMDVPGEGGAL